MRARPLLVHASSLGLAGVALGAFAFGMIAPWVLAGALAAAATPAWRSRLGRAVGLLLASTGLCSALVAPLFPIGIARVVVAPLALVTALRVVALTREHARLWAGSRGVAPSAGVDVPGALRAALLARADEREPRLEAAVSALAGMSALALPVDELGRRAFWINAYNALAAHANLGRRSASLLDALEVFRARYRVAGHVLSLDQIEHAILRGGRTSPAWPLPLLRPGDPRRRLALPLEPRVHFVLHCGARSCPPRRYVEASTLERDLEQAERAFLETETEVLPTGEVRTTKLLAWYADDFGGPEGVRRRLAEVLGRPEIEAAPLGYRDYDLRPA